ncbi:4a-hydroxytetrahydrobiopterin dehydratase [Devosia aquimaris]|uniref:4a-hydroxytetrahydrobiopterin dehydratase n=1 Tax=Devosia aquimaris TaxID=2866214 RepID=UPI001CD1783E|nr:4a-hydroxytetrahydrobiopterin dehydratase [Devosia sp. CJK-A8-3]
MVERLDAARLAQAVHDLPAWRLENGDGADMLVRVFSFADFSAAFGFMARVALAAEKAGHHPDWSNSYNKVTVRLSTHDAGGISTRDIDLAQAIDAIAG